MHIQTSDSKIKIDLKRSLRRKFADAFLVVSCVMILGVLMAISATAQFDQPPGQMGSPGYISTPAPDSFNQVPKLSGLVADKSGPQEAGISIKWTAMARTRMGTRYSTCSG